MASGGGAEGAEGVRVMQVPPARGITGDREAGMLGTVVAAAGYGVLVRWDNGDEVERSYGGPEEQCELLIVGE